MFYFRVSVTPCVISDDADTGGPATFHVLSSAPTLDDAALHVVSGLFVENGSISKIDECRAIERTDPWLKRMFSSDLLAKAKKDGFVVVPALVEVGAGR